MSITKNYSKDRKKCKVTFTLPVEAAPEASAVKVLGDFNNWSWNEGLELKAVKNEYKAQLELTAGQRYEFRYSIDEKYWENDWKADEYTESPFPGINNSVLVLENGKKPVVAKPVAKKATSAPKSTAAMTTARTVKPIAKVTKPATKAKAAKPVAKAVKPVRKRVAKKAKDFTVIEGVGPKINGLLIEAGIKTFAQLSKAKPAKLKEVLTKAGSRYAMHDPATWPKQASLAASEKWDELKVLQNELSAGRKVKK